MLAMSASSTLHTGAEVPHRKTVTPAMANSFFMSTPRQHYTRIEGQRKGKETNFLGFRWFSFWVRCGILYL